MDPVGNHLVNDREASPGVAVAAPGPRHSPLSGQPVGTLLIYLTDNQMGDNNTNFLLFA